MPPKRKSTGLIAELKRRSGRITLPAAQTTTTTSAPVRAPASASPVPSPSTAIPLSVPIANAKNIDDINWRHPAEFDLIYPKESSQADIIPILQKQAFSVPPHPTDPTEKFCTITLGLGLDAERVQVVIPLGYRIPLLFCAKYLWESVRLVLTSDDPPPEEEWEQYKFDLLNLSRLCYAFLQSALVTNRRKGKGMTKRWRSKMFDRVLTRYWWGWMVNREEFIRAFWMEFKEEEYERDVCRRDWQTMVLKGHNSFHLTPSEIAHGITAEQFTAGLLSLPPQLSSSSSDGMTYKWDNTLYVLANELVITGSRVRERDGSVDGQEVDWEGEEGRSRKRAKIDVDPADVEKAASELVRAGGVIGDGDDDVEMRDDIVVGEVEVLPTPPATSPPHSGATATQRSFPGSPIFPTSNVRASTGGESLSARAIPTLEPETSRTNEALRGSSFPVGVDREEGLDSQAPSRTGESTNGDLSSFGPRASLVSASDSTPLSNASDQPSDVVHIQSSSNIPSSIPTSLPIDFRPSNPEVINQVLDIVPGMLSQLRAIMEVAISEKPLPLLDAEKQQTTVAMNSSSYSSSASAELISSLTERIKTLESNLQSDRERRAKEKEERDRWARRIGELEGQLNGYEALSSNLTSTSASGGSVNGINGVPERYRTPISRTSSVDESCPLPVKSKRKHMNLIAMS